MFSLGPDRAPRQPGAGPRVCAAVRSGTLPTHGHARVHKRKACLGRVFRGPGSGQVPSCGLPESRAEASPGVGEGWLICAAPRACQNPQVPLHRSPPASLASPPPEASASLGKLWLEERRRGNREPSRARAGYSIFQRAPLSCPQPPDPCVLPQPPDGGDSSPVHQQTLPTMCCPSE